MVDGEQRPRLLLGILKRTGRPPLAQVSDAELGKPCYNLTVPFLLSGIKSGEMWLVVTDVFPHANYLLALPQ